MQNRLHDFIDNAFDWILDHPTTTTIISSVVGVILAIVLRSAIYLLSVLL